MLTDICVLLSTRDSPEHPGTGGARGSDPLEQDHSQETSRYQKGDTTGTSQSWKRHLRRSLSIVRREDHPHCTPGHSKGIREAVAMLWEHGCKPSIHAAGRGAQNSSHGAAEMVKCPQGTLNPQQAPAAQPGISCLCSSSSLRCCSTSASFPTPAFFLQVPEKPTGIYSPFLYYPEGEEIGSSENPLNRGKLMLSESPERVTPEHSVCLQTPCPPKPGQDTWKDLVSGTSVIIEQG